jgi:hypothetical protein
LYERAACKILVKLTPGVKKLPERRSRQLGEDVGHHDEGEAGALGSLKSYKQKEFY